MLVLAAVWWAWTTYAWLTSAIDVDEGGVRLAMLAATLAMLGVALGVPGAFGADAVFFGVAYLLVRLVHFVLSAIVARGDSDRRGVLLRFAPTALLGASLMLLAGFLDGRERIAAWLIALAIDYLGPTVIGMGRGWRVAPAHFAERHGLIILIALGESIIAIGFGAEFRLVPGVLVTAALGMIVVSALWWLYFDVAAIIAQRRLIQATGVQRAQLARDAYSYLHYRWSPGSCSSLSGSERRSTTSATHSTPCPPSRSAAEPRSTSSPRSGSSAERSAESSGGARSARSSCSPSSPPHSSSRHSPRSASSPPPVHSSSPTKQSAGASIGR